MKILIVDDEAPIKDYIAHCIRESGADYEIVGSAASGVAALRIMEQQPADLVLADITMPRMDGIELLTQIRSRWPQATVVMLTCHDDFSFARSAMQRGAADYILKSEIEPHTMRDLLGRVVERRKREHPEQIVSQRISFAKFLDQVLEDPAADLLDRDTVRAHLMGYMLHDYFVCLFRYNKAVLDGLALANFPWIRRQWTLPLENGGIFVLVDFVCGMSAGEQQRRLAEFSARVRACTDEPVGISTVYHDEAAFKRAALDARRDQSRAFYRGADKQPRADVNDVDKEAMYKQLFVYRNNAITALSVRDWPVFRDQMDGLFALAGERQVAVGRLKRLLCFIAEMAADSEQATTVLLAQIVSAAHLEELRELFREFSEKLEKSGQRYSENIEMAVAYIRKHFRDNITLQDVAGAAFLNTEYFSRRFKKEVGVNFSEYLLTLRMQEAQRLLRTTALRVSDIAEQVGIPNVSYFTSVFKKQFGTTPAESRKH